MLRLMPYGRQHYEKSVLMRDIAETCFIPEYNIGISADKDIQLKESQREDIDAIEMFVNGFVARQKTKKEIVVRHLKTYTDGDEVAVEVVEVGSSKIVLKTIDPAYNVVTGQLVLEQNLKIFSKIYPIHVWAKVLKVGERLNVRINTCNRTFSITNKFVEFLEETAVIDGCYDAYNRRVPGQLTLREFCTTEGFMVFVNLTEEEDEELRSGGLAVIAVTEYGTGQFRGCLYGEIDGYDVETRYINREDVCLPMLRRFINENSDIHLEQKGEQMDCVSGQFVKELCITLNVMQSRESNPLFRYRLLSVMRMLCVMAGFDLDDQYCIYLANYLKTLVLFAQAGHDEAGVWCRYRLPTT